MTWPPPRRDAVVRFFEKVEKTRTCWLWTAAKNPKGYGKFAPQPNRSVLAHRWSYEYAKGPIPEGMTLDQVCRVRECVNPDHLEVVPSPDTARKRRVVPSTR